MHESYTHTRMTLNILSFPAGPECRVDNVPPHLSYPTVLELRSETSSILDKHTLNEIFRYSLTLFG